MFNISTRRSATTVSAGRELQRFQALMLRQLGAAGLPVDNVLVDVTQRERVFANLGAALDLLDEDQRALLLHLQDDHPGRLGPCLTPGSTTCGTKPSPNCAAA